MQDISDRDLDRGRPLASRPEYRDACAAGSGLGSATSADVHEPYASELLDALPIAVYATNAKGRITYFNRAAEELWGRKPDLRDSYWCGSFKLFRQDGTPMRHDACPMATALKERRSVRGVEAIAERPDGLRVPFMPYPTPIFDEAGELTGAVNILVDLRPWKFAQDGNALLASIVESSDDAIVSKDLDGRVLSWNKGAERLFGYSADEAIGRPITFIIPADRQHEEPGILDRIRHGERIDHFETIRRHKDGSPVNVSLTISPVRDASARIVGASKIARDITNRKRSEARLARQMAEHAMLFRFTDRLHRATALDEVLDAALDAIIGGLCCDRAAVLLFDETARMRFVAWRRLSDEYRRIAEGHSPWTADATDAAVIHVDDVAEADLPSSLRRAAEAEGIGAIAFIPLVSGGRLIGRFVAYHNDRHQFTTAEIDLAIMLARQLAFSVERMRAEEARRKTEEQRDLLVAELSHRVKNTLATVISIARLSFAKSPDTATARHAFDARIRALAQSHGRLAETHWLGTPFESILRDEFAPFRRADGANVQLSGPRVLLNHQCALTIGMVVHELVTNAVKYGALSTESGTVAVSWRIDAENRRLEIRWVESGGPPVKAPARSGYGRMMLERALSADLDSTVELDFAETGLTCRMIIPTAKALVSAPPDDAPTRHAEMALTQSLD